MQISFNKIELKKLIITAMLTAIEIVLSRFLSFTTQNVKIGFAFIPVVLCAVVLGPVYSFALGIVSDVVGALLFPTGPYFIGFTFTSAITGLLFGLILYKKLNIPRIIISVVLTQLICSLLLNSIWITLLYGSPFLPLIITRSIQSLIMCVTEIVTLIILTKPIIQLEKYIN